MAVSAIQHNRIHWFNINRTTIITTIVIGVIVGILAALAFHYCFPSTAVFGLSGMGKLITAGAIGFIIGSMPTFLILATRKTNKEEVQQIDLKAEAQKMQKLAKAMQDAISILLSKVSADSDETSIYSQIRYLIHPRVKKMYECAQKMQKLAKEMQHRDKSLQLKREALELFGVMKKFIDEEIAHLSKATQKKSECAQLIVEYKTFSSSF